MSVIEMNEDYIEAVKAALVAALRRLADEIEHHELPVPAFKLHVGGCVESRADVQRWADHMGVAIRMGGTDRNIPVASRGIRVTDRLDLEVSFQGPAEPVASRVAELEAELAELRARVGGQSPAR